MCQDEIECALETGDDDYPEERRRDSAEIDWDDPINQE